MNTTQRTGVPKRRRSSINPAEVKRAVASNIITYATHPYAKAAVIIVSFFMCIVYYSQVEKWSVLDCVLFIVVTVSTVGYGTPHPTTDPSRMFTIFLMIFGVLAIFSNMITILNSGVTKLNKFFAKSVASRLKRTEKLFQRRLLFSVLWLALCAFLGAATFQGLEGWSYITALYFVIQTSTTVGYGDLTVQHEGTKVFLCFYILVSTSLLALAINNLYTLIQNRKYLSQRKQLLKLEKKLHFLADLNDGCGVSKFEFVLTILEHIGKLDHETDIAPWLKKFQALDTNESGILNQQQLAKFSERHAQECETEFHTIELSMSNVGALPVASRSILHDLKVNIGIFSNEELYQSENYEGSPVDVNSSDVFDDNEDAYVQDGSHKSSMSSLASPARGFIGRLRASTNRRYSMSTNLSDDEDDEEAGRLRSPTGGPWSFFQSSPRRPVSTTRAHAGSHATAPSRGTVLAPVQETNSPLHSEDLSSKDSSKDTSESGSPSLKGIAVIPNTPPRESRSSSATSTGHSPPRSLSVAVPKHNHGSSTPVNTPPRIATFTPSPEQHVTPSRSRANSGDSESTYNALLEAVEADLPDSPAEHHSRDTSAHGRAHSAPPELPAHPAHPPLHPPAHHTAHHPSHPPLHPPAHPPRHPPHPPRTTPPPVPRISPPSEPTHSPPPLPTTPPPPPPSSASPPSP